MTIKINEQLINQLTMFKKLLHTSLLLILILSGCHDNFDLPTPYGMDPDGTVEFNLTVPAMQTLATRANGIDENTVNSLSILVFNGDEPGSKLKEIISVNPNKDLIEIDGETEYDKTYRVSFKVTNSELRQSTSSIHFYFLANCSASGLEIETTELRSLSNTFIPTAITDDGFITMSGDATLSEGEVLLWRNCAKISVTESKVTADADGGLADLEHPYPFEIFSTANLTSILAGKEQGSLGEPSESMSFPESIADTDVDVEYVNPTNNKSGRGAAFVIIKAAFEKKDYYYRLDFKRILKDGEKESEEILNVIANHWYQFLIKGVTGPGAATPKEAAANPTPLIEYDIHDHSPVIYNMISDGIRELGVTHEIIYSGEASTDKDWTDENHIGMKVYIKLYSKNGESDYNINPDTNLPKGLNLVWDVKWLEIRKLKECEDQHNGNIDPDETKDEGRVYEAEVWFIEPDDFGSLESELSVSWQGLTRKVPVTWERTFDASKLVTVTLKIYDETANQTNYGSTGLKKTIDNYFGFLDSEDNPVNGTPILYGVNPASNNQKIRNEGFHFPVMYGFRSRTGGNGERDSRWSYLYEVNFNNKDDNKLANVKFDWKIEISGDQTITDYVKVDGNPNGTAGTRNAGQPWSFTISRLGNATGRDGSVGNQSNDYTYGTGTLKLTLTPYNTGDEDGHPSGVPQEYNFDLYHTGFFHYNEYTNNRVDAAADNAFYYYEVVPIQGASRMRYWLDRNLGAKSAGLYIQATGGVTYYGDKDAAGGYYRVADYSKNGPIMYDKSETQENRVSPPGYRVPMQKVWNALRNSTNFDTEAVGGYFNSCYHSSVGDVFFPKARYRDQDGNDVGESRAGYYWTATNASGVEKEESGRWLKALSISGETTSYINGAVYSLNKGYIVDGSNLGNNGYAMSVRSINDIDDSANPSRTVLMVAGATHVYLYRIENGVRIATTTWPGHVIGNAYTMSDPNNWFQFSYESDNLQPEDFYVIFNYVDENGKIYSMGQNTTLADASTIAPSKIEGWKVADDENFKEVESGVSSDYLGNPTANNYYWRCYYKNQNKVYCYNTQPPFDDYVFRIWWNATEFSSFPFINILGMTKGTGSLKDGYYYYDFRLSNQKSFPAQTFEYWFENNRGETYQDWGKINFKTNSQAFKRESDGIYHYTIEKVQEGGSGYSGRPRSVDDIYIYRIYWPYNYYSFSGISLHIDTQVYKPGWYVQDNFNAYLSQTCVTPSAEIGLTNISYGRYNETFAYLEFSTVDKLPNLKYYTYINGNSLFDQVYTAPNFNPVKVNGKWQYTLTDTSTGYNGLPRTPDPSLDDGYYRIYWNPTAPDNSAISLKYVYIFNAFAYKPDGSMYEDKSFTEGSQSVEYPGYRYFDFKPYSISAFPSFILTSDTSWSNQTMNISIDKNSFNSTNKCCLLVITGTNKYVVSLMKSKPQSAPRRKARSINQAKAGRR